MSMSKITNSPANTADKNDNYDKRKVDIAKSYNVYKKKNVIKMTERFKYALTPKEIEEEFNLVALIYLYIDLHLNYFLICLIYYIIDRINNHGFILLSNIVLVLILLYRVCL